MATGSRAPRARAAASKPPEALGRIEKLVVENFKSYSGVHEIGPFDKFTCIIGPNGSGKSNIMDAISFCLGIRAKHLRGDRLKDLVYRREEEDVESNSRSAKVMMVFRSASGEVFHFGRNINARGEGNYRFGTEGKIKSYGYDDFIQQLANQRIYVKARNFLVFQGDVMELARRQGTDLTGVLETISGSDQLKEEYVRLQRELELTQEKARMHFQHRREIEGTVSMLAKQRAEVERYQELRKRRDLLVVEKALFRLFCAEHEAARTREEAAALRSSHVAAEAEMKTRRKEAEEAEAERKKAETEAEKAQSQHFVLSSNLEQLKPEIANCKKQASHWAKQLREREGKIREEEAKLRSLEAGTKQAQEDRQAAEAEIARLKAQQTESAVQLTDSQRAEYEKAVEQTDLMNIRTRDRLREAEEQLVLFTREQSADKQDLRDLEDKHKRSIAKLEELGSEKAALELELDSESTVLEQKKRQAATVLEEVKKFTTFRDSLVDEQRSLRMMLDSAKMRREKLDQLEASQRIADELRSAYPDGVLGRISELVLPTQKRFENSLQHSMGGLAEAFVVSNAEVGRECVRYLKDRKISSETFLPLDRMTELNVGPIHLLVQGKEARRLASACVQPNERFLDRHPRWRAQGPSYIEKTVKFLLNGTIIVDDLDEAKRTFYQDAKKRGLQPRVVTLDGEVIAPNGNMSISGSGGSNRAEFGGADQLHEIKVQEEKLRQVEKDLATLNEESARKLSRDRALRDEAQAIEEKYQTIEHRLRAVDAAQVSEQKTLHARAQRIDELKTKIERGVGKLEELEEQKDKLEGELLKVGKKYFEELNQQLGVDDVREIMLKEQREKHKLRQQIEEFEDLIRSLANDERTVEQRLRSSTKLEGLKRDCEQYRRDIEVSTKRLQELEEKTKVFSERCEASKTRLAELSLAKEKLEVDVKDKRDAAQKLRAQVEDAKKKLKKHNDKVRVLLNIQCGILRDCNERQIELPFITKDDAALEQVISREQDIEDMSFADLEAAWCKLEVDFSSLPKEKQEIAEQTRIFDTKSVEAEYETMVAEISRELDGLSPNMRAVEECANEEEKLRDIRRQADEAGLESQKLARAFEEVKVERVSRFMRCFKHVEEHVHPFYKELTSYDGFEGGSAYLDLDDAEEPYNGGITFTACPPGKRFFPMELLSGGERSMASMALLFAMHSYQPPPFMILDEVDAPFDRKNTNSLVRYLKKLHFQCLVISLKDTFFSHSDSIIGIYKDKEVQSSGHLSLPLSQLGLESEAPETEVPLAESDGGEYVD